MSEPRRGARRQGDTWRCNTCGTWLARIDHANDSLIFNRRAQVVLDPPDRHARGAPPVRETWRRGDEVNGVPVHPTDVMVIVLCTRCNSPDAAAIIAEP